MDHNEQERLLDRWNEVDASLALLNATADTDAESQALYDRLVAEERSIREQVEAAIVAPDVEQSAEYDNCQQMTDLAELFPTLRGVSGVRPWDQHKIDEWACSGAATSGSRCAVQFLLMVWGGTNKGYEWKCGPFDLTDALGSWDVRHKHAFMKWVRDPFWP